MVKEFFSVTLISVFFSARERKTGWIKTDIFAVYEIWDLGILRNLALGGLGLWIVW